MSQDFNFFFPELSEDGENIPLPPEEMRFLELRGEPVMDDGPLRARVYVEVTPFQRRPFIELVLTGENNAEIATANIIEPMQRKNVLTMHIRGPQKQGVFHLAGRLYYPTNTDDPTQPGETHECDRAQAEFNVA